MVNTIIPDLTNFLNQQTKAQEKIELCLWKLGALINVPLMTDNFFKVSEKNLHSYFMILADLIEDATKANDATLSSLFEEEQSDSLVAPDLAVPE